MNMRFMIRKWGFKLEDKRDKKSVMKTQTIRIFSMV